MVVLMDSLKLELMLVVNEVILGFNHYDFQLIYF